MTTYRPRSRPRARSMVAFVLIGLFVAAAAGAGTGRSGGAAEPEPDRPGRVLVVSIPRLAWDQVIDNQPEHLTRFLEQSAVGNLSLRTIGARTALGEAYLTMGAGNRAGVRDEDSGRMLDPEDRFENGTARDAYIRRTGRVPDDSALLQLSIPAIQALNDRYTYGAEPGALGSMLADAGIVAALVANADLGTQASSTVTFDPAAPTGEPGDGAATEQQPIVDPPGFSAVISSIEPVQGENRPAGLALMDADGEVAAGTVSRDLLTRDPATPFGVRLSEEKILEAVATHWVDDSVALVELSDLERADLYRSRAADEQADALVNDALERTDALFGKLLDQVSPDDLVIVVSPAAPRVGETLTPLAIRGEGFSSGTLSSGTTRRGGYVTLPDVAPTILEQLQVDQPEAMTGAPMAATNDGDRSSARYLDFLERNEATRFRDHISGPITVLLVVIQVLLYGLGLVALWRGSPLLRRVAALGSLLTMSIPVVTFALGLVRVDRLGFAPYLLLMFLGAAGLAATARLFGWGDDPRRAAMRVAMVPVATTYGAILVDIVLGGRLQINTAFGYSPVVAGRFAGFGNPAYALFSMGALLLACGFWVLFGGGGRPGPRRRWLLAAIIGLFAVTVVVDGHPALGSDVGGILSIIPAAFIVVWLLLGRRLRLRVVLVSGAVTLATVAVFAALDLGRPASEQTHLARLVRSTVGDDGLSGLLTVVERKVNANLTILTSSVWTWAIPLGLLLLVRFTWRRPQLFETHLDDEPSTRACLWGGIALSGLGMAVNDSGIAVPAVMFTLFLPFVLYQALSPAELPVDGGRGGPAEKADDGGGDSPGGKPAPDSQTDAPDSKDDAEEAGVAACP